MAYHVYLFVRTGEPVAQRAARHFTAELTRRHPHITATPGSDHVGVMSYDLTTGEAPGAYLNVGLTTRPDTVREQIEWGLTSGGPPTLRTCDSFITLVTSGAPGGDLLDAAITVIESLWPATVYDEMDGFTPDES